MATNHIQPGKNLTFIASGAITSGQLVVQGSIFGVAAHDAAQDETITIETGGVWALPKVSANTPTVGAPAYWDGSAVTTATESGGGAAYLKIGVFMAALGAGTTSAPVRLNSCF